MPQPLHSTGSGRPRCPQWTVQLGDLWQGSHPSVKWAPSERGPLYTADQGLKAENQDWAEDVFPKYSLGDGHIHRAAERGVSPGMRDPISSESLPTCLHLPAPATRAPPRPRLARGNGHWGGAVPRANCGSPPSQGPEDQPQGLPLRNCLSPPQEGKLGKKWPEDNRPTDLDKHVQTHLV